MKSLTKGVLLANGILTLPFGVICLAYPADIFSSYGITLDAGGALVARGYGATLVGYGLLFYFQRNVSGLSQVKSLLIASIFFNLLETLIQAEAAIKEIVPPLIWLTITLHALLTMASAYLIAVRKSKQQ